MKGVGCVPRGNGRPATKPTRHIKRETDRHREAFEYYWSLGADRTLRAVARHFNVSEQSVVAWSKSFGWQARIAEREAEIARQFERRVIQHEVDRRSQNLKIVDAAKLQFVQALREGKIVFKYVTDLETILRLERMLLGDEENDRDNPLAKLAEQLQALRDQEEGGADDEGNESEHTAD